MKSFNFSPGYKYLTFGLVFFISFFSFSTEGVGDGAHKIVFLMPLGLLVMFTFFQRILNFEKSLSLLVFLGFLLSIYNALITTGEINFFLNINISIAIAVLLLSAVENNRLIFLHVLKFFILVNCAAIIYQGVSNYFFGQNLYLHAELFSFSRQAYSLSEAGFNRLSGYQMEPGSAAVLVLFSSVLLFLIERKVTFINWLSILAAIMTFSSMAVLLIPIVLVIFYHSRVKNIKSLLLGVVVVIVMGVLAVSIGFFEYLTDRFGSAQIDNSSYYKISNVLAYFNQPLIEMIAGIGFGEVPATCFSCAHISGNGSFFYTLSGVGIFALVLYFLPLFILKNKFEFFLCLLLLSISRYSLIYIQFWVFLFFTMKYTQVKDSEI